MLKRIRCWNCVFFPFYGITRDRPESTSSQACSRARPPSEPCERVLTQWELQFKTTNSSYKPRLTCHELGTSWGTLTTCTDSGAWSWTAAWHSSAYQAPCWNQGGRLTAGGERTPTTLSESMARIRPKSSDNHNDNYSSANYDTRCFNPLRT